MTVTPAAIYVGPVDGVRVLLDWQPRIELAVHAQLLTLRPAIASPQLTPYSQKAVSPVCDCEHHSHDPSGAGKQTAHDFGAREGVATIKSPWGGTFWLCRECLDAGHMQGLQFR